MELSGAETAVPAQIRPTRFSLATVDVLRAAAALAVLLHHVGNLFNPPAAGQGQIGRTFFAATEQGRLGVSLFFVISGFCIHLPYAHSARINAREFLVRRFVRVWPPFAVAIVAGLFVRIAMGDHSASLLVHALSHLLFFFSGSSPIRYDNVVFWSIVVEVQLYVIYLAIRIVNPRGSRLGLWTLGFVIFGILYHAIAPFVPLNGLAARVLNARFFAPARMGEWMMGALVAQWMVDRGAHTAARATCLSWAIGGAAVVVFTRTMTQILAVDYYAFETVDAAGFAMLLWGLVSLEQRHRAATISGEPSAPSRQTRLWRTLVAIGHRSYSLYLFHFLVLNVVATWIATTVLGAGTTLDRLRDTRSGWIVIGCAIVAVFVVTELSYRLVERPTHQLARRLGQRAAHTL